MKVYNFKNFQSVFNACRLAQQHKMLVLIAGDSGYGKTFAFNYFSRKNENVFINELRATDKSKLPWERSLVQVSGKNDYKSHNLSLDQSMNALVGELNMRSSPNLVVLDEAGFLSHGMLRYFRSLVDRTKKSTGFVISGPDYFIENLKHWIKLEIPGIAELDTRIDLFVKLSPPDFSEKKFACEREGITDSLIIRKICSQNHNFRDLFRAIDFQHKGIEGRNEWEWEKSLSEIE